MLSMLGPGGLAHTGKFAQNFFHISVILGCIPLLFLQFWVKDYKNKPLTILEVIKETLGFILKIMKKLLGGATIKKYQ